MKERPILFSTPMVQAILDNRKTMTRRVIKPQPKVIHEIFQHQGNIYAQTELLEHNKNAFNGCVKCPYGQIGDRLWVRETYSISVGTDENAYICTWLINYKDGTQLIQNPTEEWHDKHPNGECNKWYPSIFMPRWASRITLEITNIKVERLHGITDEDAIKEGITVIGRPELNELSEGKFIHAFSRLWDSINGKTYPFESNPWVWVIEFKRIS